MKVKTSELAGVALDWAVPKCEGKEIFIDKESPEFMCLGEMNLYRFSPTRYWAQGGPIIETEGINLGTQRNESGFRPHLERMWHAQKDGRVHVGYGPTPLITAMRCYVSAKLGDEVDVPEGLV